MPTSEEQEKERAVFNDEDDSDDSEAEDSDEDDSDDDADDASAAAAASAGRQPAPPPPQASSPPAAAAAVDGLNSSAQRHSSDAPNPNLAPILNPNPGNAPSDPTASLNGAIPVVTVPIAAAAELSSDPFPASAAIVTATVEERRPLACAYDESRRLFQRLWNDDDEIKILQGFFEFTSKRGTTFASHQYDTGPFYEDIKKQLNLEFTKNQLIEKLRRLKKKYRNCVSRMRSMGKDFTFKSAHERAIYDIARNIWSANVKRARDSDDEDLNTSGNANSNEIITVPVNAASLSTDRRATRRSRFWRRMAEEAAVAGAATTVGGVAIENSAPAMHTPLASVSGFPSMIEETVKSCLSPLFKELITSAISSPFSSGLGGGARALNLLPLNLGSTPLPAPGAHLDEKWKNQQIMELEVYLKRIELVRDYIMSRLEELKSSSS